jgi:hypothetical protein
MVERDKLSVVPPREDLEHDRSSQEIRQDIAAKRESITETVERIGDTVNRTLDWRTYAADYPLVALGAAAGLGFLLTRIFAPKPTPRERILDAIADGVEDLKDQFGGYLDVVPQKKAGVGNSVKAAAVGLLTKAATDYAKNALLAKRKHQNDDDYREGTRTSRAPVL